MLPKNLRTYRWFVVWDCLSVSASPFDSSCRIWKSSRSRGFKDCWLGYVPSMFWSVKEMLCRHWQYMKPPLRHNNHLKRTSQNFFLELRNCLWGKIRLIGGHINSYFGHQNKRRQHLRSIRTTHWLLLLIVYEAARVGGGFQWGSPVNHEEHHCTSDVEGDAARPIRG